ncbi:MAG: DUF6088 family protein [Planctomycetia bacterium]
MSRPKSPNSIDARILAAVRAKGRGSVFASADFLGMGSRSAVDVTLHRLVAQRKIRRLARGVYDLPRKHTTLGPLLPSPESVAKTLARRDRTRLQPAGAFAANALGLTEQVPAKVVFLTDGPSRTVRIGATTIQLRRTTPKNMETAGRLSGMVIQAFRSLGKDHITPERIAHLKRTIPAAKRRELLDDIPLAPGWMQPIFRELAGGDD